MMVHSIFEELVLIVDIRHILDHSGLKLLKKLIIHLPLVNLQVYCRNVSAASTAAMEYVVGIYGVKDAILNRWTALLNTAALYCYAIWLSVEDVVNGGRHDE
ncbi:hypothetical protein Tco_1019534 [Tanacetum coccineum]|uniref:Uncharacterized protein n=1 Tax=Tanacetum coccineum TaxID=301880 RepID=A0ABQ5FXV7_9ASTR